VDGEEEVARVAIEEMDQVESPVVAAPGDAHPRDPDPESLGEVDFYIDQGLVEEARGVALRLRERFPESEEVTRRLERIDGSSAQKPSPAPPQEDPVAVDLEVERALSGHASGSEPAEPDESPRAERPSPVFRMETPAEEPEGDYFDLASELGKSLDEAQQEADAEARDALEGPSHSLEDIFTAFKKGVEQQVGSDDYDTHYNLGIAYREMGLVDEAIGAFQFAARDPSRIVECCGILGLCFRDKGMPELALKWYRKGLDSPDLEDQMATGLRYDMAEVYREQGDYQNALKVYTDVYGIDSTYRDVAQKIEEMRGHLN
jgi:tetratricopeptide (TPR) repeat protein